MHFRPVASAVQIQVLRLEWLCSETPLYSKPGCHCPQSFFQKNRRTEAAVGVCTWKAWVRFSVIDSDACGLFEQVDIVDFVTVDGQACSGRNVGFDSRFVS